MLGDPDIGLTIALDVDVLIDQLQDSAGIQEHYARSRVTLQTPRNGLLTIQVATAAGDQTIPNEDTYAIRLDRYGVTAAVFDGATSLRPIPTLEQRGISGARFASHLLQRGTTIVDRRVRPRELLAALNATLARVSVEFDGVDPADTNTLPSSSATIVRCNWELGILEFASVYDSWCVIYREPDDRLSSELLTEDCNRRFDNPILELMRWIATETGTTPRQARGDPRVAQALLSSRVATNNAPGGTGCGIVNGNPEMVAYIESRSFPLDGIRAVLIGTDGLIPPEWSIEDEDDRRRLFEVITQRGFEQLIALKRQSEDHDPDWLNVRFKHSDDATGVLLLWE